MNRPRRFVNLVLNTVVRRQRAFALHRVDVSPLFHPPAGPAADAKQQQQLEDEQGRRRGGAMVLEDALLPRAAMIFHACPSYGLGASPSTVDFMPLGGGGGRGEKNDIVAVDYSGSGVLYGVASRAVSILPPLHKAKVFPVSLTVDDSVYVMERYPASSELPSCCFEVLINDCHHKHCDAPPHWHWRVLTPPPFAFVSDKALGSVHNTRPAANYCDVVLGEDDDFLTAYTAVGGSSIWMTVRRRGAGTYSFDTASGTWSKLGDWALPFRGRAEYAPEHKLWFALSFDGNELCASDLAAAGAPPRRCNVWKVGPAPPSDWFSVTPYLVPLGAGRFCVVRFVQKGRRLDFHFDEQFVVFTGVEVQRGGKDGRALQMVTHRSRRYSLLKRVIVTIAEIFWEQTKLKRKRQTATKSQLQPFASQSIDDIISFLSNQTCDHGDDNVCLLIHNIDGPALRHAESQQYLAHVSFCPKSMLSHQ